MTLNRRVAIAILMMGLTVRPASAGPVGPIKYEVSVASLAERKFRVAITIAVKPDAKGARDSRDSNVALAIPAWSPGYYQILNFQKDISNFQALDDKGKSLAVARPTERTWAVLGGYGAIHVTYDVTAKDAGFGFFGSHLDDKTGYINGASALMYVVDGKELPTTIRFHVPKDWKVATPLDRADVGQDTDGVFKASGYDDLIDCPIQMGQFDSVDFTTKATPFSAVLVGAGKVDKAALKDVLNRVTEAGIGIFGYAPFKRYIFFIHFATGNFGGGLEHHNSTVLNVWQGVADDPHALVDLAAHEFFHAFNVKRLHPAVLGPFDYTKKVRTGALWFAEGVTDYYACVLPLTARLSKESDFLAEVASRIRQLQQNDARLHISVEEASQKAWEGGSMGFGGLSYYLKGSLIGLLLDVKIRAATDNAKSLDDVMRLLDERYGKKGIGYEEDGLLKAINEVSGTDMSDFYNRYVQSTQEIPWNEILKEAGLVYEAGSTKVAFLGVSTEPAKTAGLSVLQVSTDSAAQKAGIHESDRIVTLNGSRIEPSQFQAAIARMRPGQQITVGVRRGETAMDLPVTLGEREDKFNRLRPLDTASDRAKRIRAGLLREASPSSASATSAVSSSGPAGSRAAGAGR